MLHRCRWCILICIINALLVGALACDAKSATGFDTYWTTQKAEATVYNSPWADRHNIMVVDCAGIGRPHQDAAKESYFRRFYCQADYDAAFYGDGFLCTLSFTVRPVSDGRFALIGGDNPQCYPDQGYVPGN